MTMNVVVEPMRMDDINDAVGLHMRAFPDSRSTKLGKVYVKKMFCWFLEYQADLSLAARKDGEIIGYVIGAVGGYGRKLFRYAFFEVVFGLLSHPGLWFQSETFLLWESYLKGLLPEKTTASANEINPHQAKKAALAGIAVDPDQRGQKIGTTLVIAFETAAANLGVDKLTLSVHSDNLSARRLYDRCGWTMDSENQAANTVHYMKVIS